MKHIILILAVLFGSLNASTFKHTNQDTIVSLSPAPSQTNVYPDANINIVFNVELDPKRIKHNAIRLRHIDKKKTTIKGSINYNNDTKTLSFIPDRFLIPGIYEVDMTALKPIKQFKNKNIKNITYRFSVADIQPLELKIIPTPIEVKEGSTLDLKVNVVYSDDSEKQAEGISTWSSRDPNILSIEQNATAIGVKEGETVVTTSYKGLTSKETQALVYLEVNGHRLPFEPDPAINNSTLLGIDVNENGVRDDVERYVIIRFSQDEFPKTKTAIAMQWAFSNQIMLSDPSVNSNKLLEKASACQWYWLEKITANISNTLEAIKYAKKNEVYKKEFEDKIFNTKNRIKKRFEFLEAVSGNIYTGIEHSIENCQTNIDEFGE